MTSVLRSVVTGVGSYLPTDEVTNDDLAKVVDTSDAWIFERTGIHSIGSTFPLVLSELVSVSRVTLTNSTSGGAAFFVATQATITAAPTKRMASQLRLRLTGGSSQRGQLPFSQNLFQHR